MKLRRFGGIIALALLMTSCLTYEQVDVKNIEGFRVQNLLNNNEPTQLELDVRVDNPNNYKIKLKDADLNLFVGSKDLGKVKLAKTVSIPKKSESVQTVVIEPESKDMLQAALQGGLSALLTGKVKVRVKGRIKGKAMGIGKWFDVDHSEQVDLKDKFFEPEPAE